MTSSLNFNFLNSLKHWSTGLAKIAHQMPHMDSHFRDSLNETNMDAAIWAVESLKPIIEEHSLRQEKLKVMVLHSWLGLPLIPLLCENFDIGELILVELDADAIELSKVFHRHYSQERYIPLHHLHLDTPFAIPQLNAIQADVVINLHCEQMYPLSELRVANPYAIYCMQSSHVPEELLGINVVENEKALADQLDLPELLFSGTKLQEVYTWQGRKFYDRFMVIGTRDHAE